MKRAIVLLSFLLVCTSLATFGQCCKSAKVNGSCAGLTKNQDNCDQEVKAYYFHGTHRCETCLAVENVTKEALKEYYNDKVPFQSINREEESTNPMIEKYKISGQTLLIIKGNKVVDLTNQAFLNARTKPDKFKAKLKSTIDSMK